MTIRHDQPRHADKDLGLADFAGLEEGRIPRLPTRGNGP